MPDFNIFQVLNLKAAEDPHDRILTWLLDPSGGHEIPDLAHSIIAELWEEDCREPIQKVTRQFKLSDESWPDIGIEFVQTLLLIENKVQAAALREGQIELQHQLGRERQNGAPLRHCVLCPDRLVEAIPVPSTTFRVLRYSVLADLIEARLGAATLESRPILKQYADFIRTSFGSPAPREIRIANGATLGRRNGRSEPWAWEEILNEAEKIGGPTLALNHQILLDLLTAMDVVEPRFESRGASEATYKVCLAGSSIEYLLLVYGSGRLYASWQGLLTLFRTEIVEDVRSIWAPHVKGPQNRNGSDTRQNLGEIKPEQIAILLQETADLISSG